MKKIDKPLIIEAIKTDVCYFLRESRDNYTYYNGSAGVSGLDHFLFDGKKLERSHNPSWCKILKVPKKIEEEVSQPNINHRYELIDKTLKSSKFPLVLEKDNITYMNDEGYTQWKQEYSQLQSLYAEISDTQPNIMINTPFEFKIVMEFDNIKEYGGFSYPVQKGRWESDGFYPLTEKYVQHQEIDTILFPDIILPARESHLTSEQTYKIIRKHVQDNINGKYAHITSDYDFCFTVKKKIPLAVKEPYQKNIARYGAREPKYVTDYRHCREIQVFEMTHQIVKYNNYTIVEGFKGNNVEELKENIDNYLRDLMDKINSPLHDCPNCNGVGVIVENK